jgi:hypothetical protein
VGAAAADTALQRKALMLLEHLSHSHNLSTVGSLAQRARAALQALEGGCVSSSALPLPAGEVQRAVASLAAAAAFSNAGSDSARPQHAPAALTAQGAAAGLGCCTLRLLKLLSVAAFDDSLSVGSMLSKGAFSEVMAGMVRSVTFGAVEGPPDSSCSCLGWC